MTNREFEILYKKIIAQTIDKELNVSFQELRKMITETNNSELSDQCQMLEDTYKNLLNYAMNGVVDPSQETIYNQLQTDLLRLADKARDLYFTKNSNNIVYQKKREIQRTLTETTDLSQYSIAECFHNIFQYVWLTESFSGKDVETMKNIFASDDVAIEEKSVYVTAITLALLRTFDESKFQLLLDLVESNVEMLQQRALVGLIFCVNVHTKRISLAKNLNARFTMMFQDENLAEDLKETIIQILRSNETEKFAQKMREELPNILKNTPFAKPLNDQNINIEKLLTADKEELEKMDEVNPEWQSLIDNSSISERAKEISEFQMEGGDIFMGTFSQLKQYPFFKNIENWFLPFYDENIFEAYKAPHMDTSVVDSLIGLPFLCNSDKYSMLASYAEIPPELRSMLMQTIQTNKEHIAEMKEDALKVEDKKAILIAYIQDLHRFYKLNRDRNDFYNPLSNLRNLHENLIVKINPRSNHIMRAICDYQMRRENYDLAVEISEKLLEEEPGDIDLTQKTALCYQKLKDYKKAIYYYEKADSLTENDLWVIEHLAYCQKQVGNNTDSLANYERCLAAQPENIKYQRNVGNCLIQLERYEEALKIFYKIDYIDPENAHSAKAIGWCSFVSHKLESAEKYYKKSPEESRNENDWMNIGHILLCEKKMEEAITYYNKAYQKIGKDRQQFAKMFSADEAILVSNGVKAEDFPLVRDYIPYKIEE